MYSSDKDLNKFVKTLVAGGWYPFKTKGHWKIKSPKGTVHTISSSPSDFRTVIKFKSDIKRTLRKEENVNRV